MTPAQILRQNFGRRPIRDDGEFVSDLEAARTRHLHGEEQPTRPVPEPLPPEDPPMEWPEEPKLVPTLEVEF
jgi:hypothetical protein